MSLPLGIEVVVNALWLAAALVAFALAVFVSFWAFRFLWKLCVVINGRLRPLSAYYMYELHEEIKRRENAATKRRPDMVYSDGGQP